MAKNVNKKFTINLDISTEDAEKQVKIAAGNIKKVLADMGNAADKMTVLKDAVSYIGQIDQALDALKAKGSTFSHIFDGMDVDLKKVLENIFGVTSESMTALEELKTQVAMAKANPATTKDDLKPLEQKVKSLYTALNMKAEISGQGKIETRITKLENALENFGVVFEGVKNKLKEGLNFGETGEGNDILPYLKEQNEKIQEEIKKLQKAAAAYKEVWDILHGTKRVKKITDDNAVQVLDQLNAKYLQAAEAAEKFKNTEGEASENYKKQAMQAIRYAALLKNTIDQSSEDSEVVSDWVVKYNKNNSYDKLTQFLQSMRWSDTAKSVAEYVKQQISKVNTQITSLKTGEMAQSATSGLKTITKGADNASKAIQKVMYHLGNLLNGKGKKQDTFDEMPFNLTEAVQGNDKYEKYGFGVLGGGLFGVSDPSMIDQKDVVSSKFIHGIDLSKYNMYLADTEERAAALMDFLSKLQKYAMKQAEPNYKGFDSQLDGVNIDTLYDQFKVVFNESDLTKEKLNSFLTDMVGLLHQAGLKFDADLNELVFTSIGNLEGSENISTRFMKMLGYHGVNVGGTSFDGFGQGSVLFDFKDTDLVSYFNNVGQAVDDFNKRINDGSWDGSNEQLKQYRENIDAIIARLQEYEQKYQKPSITKNVNDTVAKLTQTKSVIDQLLYGGIAQAQDTNKNVVFDGNKSLKEKLNLIKQIGKTYEQLAVLKIEDSISGAALEETEDQVKDFEEKYHSLIATLSDGTKIKIRLDMVDVDEQIDQLMADTDKIKDIDLVPKEAGQAVDAYEKIDLVMSNIGKQWKNLDTVERAVGSVYPDSLEAWLKSLQSSIKSIESFDPNFQYGTKEIYDGAVKTFGKLQELSNRTKLSESFGDAVNQFEQLGKFQWNDDINNGYADILKDIRNGTYTTVDQCIAKFDELIQSVQVTKAYDDIFDVLHNVGNQWKDLDTVDSAVGFIPLSDIDQYVQKLESLVKAIDSIDPNFQHGDKTEYDGAVKTLEKLKTLSERTKLTDEFKNTINQFEQLGKFQWSNELTNGYLNILKDIRKGTYETIGQCVAKFNELSTAANKPTMDVSTAFRELVKHISSSHSSPATIFDHLEGTTLKVSDNLKEILEALNLIDKSGKVNLTSLKTGFTNKGGFVSDQYTMIARPDYYLGKIQSIQPKLQQAQKEGAQIGAIFDIIEDKAKGLIYEIQNTVPGESVLGHHSGKTNKDVLNASVAQIEGLVNTLQILAKNGLFVDWGGDNVLYDKDKGFSIIDMGDKGGKHFTVSTQNTLQENLDRMVQEMFKYSSLDMQQALKDGMVKNLYASAQKLDSSVVNPYAPKQQKAAQTASTQVAAAVRSESDAHDQNTASINAENEALKAQIELKKQAQSMKWEAFATDDSLSALKQAAGMQTLGQLEGFWKKANYEKQIDFHEITDTEAKQIFKDKLPKGLASKWYSSADFLSKSKLENEILADDEIRNAAMSYFWHIFKNSYSSKKYPNIKTFEDFLDTEMTMYRGDQAPLIYDPSSKLSFSINESTANGFNANLGTIKIKPKDTIGNAGSTFTSELETFAPSEQTSWFKKTREAFEDFYNNQTKEMQKEIDAGLVNFEKKRVSDILGDDLSTLTHKALQSSYWKHNVADDLKNGIIPENITVPTDGSDYAQFADAYNGLNDSMKRFVMFFASMDQLSASLPKPFSISTQTAGGGYKYGKNAVGADAKLFNAILNDPEGRHQHLAKLTGEQTFNLMGQTPAAINAEADAHERNAQAVAAEAQAKKDLSSLQERYDHVMDDLWDSSVDADGSKHKDLSKLWSQLYDVQHSEQDLVDQGMYTQKSTGDDVQATDLFQLVVDIEQKYNENLDYVKDYLKQVYSNIDFGNITPALMSPTQADFDATKTKTYETAKNAYKSGNQREYFKILSVLNHLNDVEAADAEDIAKAQYTDTDTGRRYDVSKLIGMVKSIEDAYGESFDYVYDYLKKVYGDATIDDALANLPDDVTGTRRETGSQYTVDDYEKIYAASPADMQAAIDDLAVFQQRYEQLYALTNTQPIEIMFPGKPTLDEVDQVIAAFEEFKSKQRQIFQLQMLDYEGNKDKIQELQAEAVGLQNKLRDAALGEDADLSEYKLTYGFMDDQDADRFKNLVEMTESVHTVMNDLTRIGEHKMSLIPPEMQDMLEYESGDTAERFMALHAQQVQSAKAAAQQADASAAAAKQQLQTEQDITSEKQRQASLTDQQAAQTPADAVQTQTVQTEAVAMDTLLQQVEAVKAAVIAKTDAFTAEGVAVEETVNKEIAALTQLKTLLDSIQSSLQLIFASNNWSIGDVNVSQDKTSSNSMPNILGEIKSILGQIYGVLSKSTGVEADNKNSANYKAPVVDTTAQDVDAYKYLADKLPKDVATESTLSAILAAVNQLAKVPKDFVDQDVMSVSSALLAASAELKGVASGIIQQQKATKSDTSAAQARIANKDSYVQIKSAALGSLGDRALESEVTEMQALSNGIVKVTGWLKVAEDEWEGFTVKINEANEASGLAIEQNTKAAKQAAAQAQQMKLYAQATANQAQKPKASYGINKNAYGATSVSTIQGKFNTLAAQAQPYAAGGWSDIAAAYQKAETALQNLIALQSQFQGKKMPDNHSQFVQYKDACNAANKELKKLLENADEFSKTATKTVDVASDVDINDRSSRATALKDYVQDMYGAEAVIRGFNADMTELQFTIKKTGGVTENMTASFNSAKTQLGSLHGETKKAATMFDMLSGKFQELWRYALARMGVDDVIRAVRQGVEYVREIDAALTDLKKVTDETDATYDAFLQTMSKTAGAVGSTVSDLTTMAAEWARLGYSLEEAGMLAESTAILLNVSEFDDATTASEALISTMQAFGYAADESQHVVDVLNEIGNNYAVSSDGLATALQDSASSLMEAGNNLEQSVALIAAANKVVQDPNSVGSALRTISLRLRGTSVSVLEELGEETDGAVESVSKLQSKVQALSGVNILDDTGAYKDTYTILSEIGSVWEDMSDIDQAALLELLAGEILARCV